jgi:opacity protein-like surface antigen
VKKILAAFAVTVTLGAPALAQSFDPEAGTGNVLPFSHTSDAHKADRMAVRQGGLSAYAAVPGGAVAGSFAPSATGGGSAGYNEMLRNY